MSNDKNTIITAVKESARKVLADQGKNLNVETLELFRDFDSLALMTFLVELEEELGRRLGRPISLADPDIFDPGHRPLRNIASLSDHLAGKLVNSKGSSHETL